MSPESAERCPACGAPLLLVWVHGHGQCSRCGQNVVPCCMGAGDESDAVQPASGAAGAEDLPALHDDLLALLDDLLALLDDLLALLDAAGGTLTRATLLNRFAQRSGCGWERGQELIRAGVAAGLLSIEAGDLVVRTVAPQ